MYTTLACGTVAYLQRSLPPIHSVTCFQSLAKSIDASAVIFEMSVRACVCVSNHANAQRPRCDVPS